MEILNVRHQILCQSIEYEERIVPIREIATADGRQEVQCRWFVDASGRNALLKRQLDLAKPTRHNVNTAWFRIDHPIDVDSWSDEIQWGNRIKHSRLCVLKTGPPRNH